MWVCVCVGMCVSGCVCMYVCACVEGKDYQKHNKKINPIQVNKNQNEGIK